MMLLAKTIVSTIF